MAQQKDEILIPTLMQHNNIFPKLTYQIYKLGSQGSAFPNLFLRGSEQ